MQFKGKSVKTDEQMSLGKVRHTDDVMEATVSKYHKLQIRQNLFNRSNKVLSVP